MEVDELSFTTCYARQLIHENIARELGTFHESHDTEPPVGVPSPCLGGACLNNPLLETSSDHPEEGTLDKSLVIGTAVHRHDPKIAWSLYLEASDRIGGRVYYS
jgi:hypothetical protein